VLCKRDTAGVRQHSTAWMSADAAYARASWCIRCAEESASQAASSEASRNEPGMRSHAGARGMLPACIAAQAGTAMSARDGGDGGGGDCG
jgi:hypothetical protein